jgi:putative phosphoribosyl transferase
VAPPEAVDQMAALADEVLVLRTPRSFTSVGMYYRDFRQLSDADVVALLRSSG